MSKSLVHRSAKLLARTQLFGSASLSTLGCSPRQQISQHHRIGSSALSGHGVAAQRRLLLIGGVRFRSGDDYSVMHHYLGDADQSADQKYLNRLMMSRHDQRHGKVAQNIFKEMVKNNGEGLTLQVATKMIEALAMHNKLDVAIEALRFARLQGIRPKIYAYSAVIGGCFKAQEYVQALRMFEVMRKDGYVPMQVTYSHALVSAMKSDKHDLVLEIFDDMLLAGVETTIVIYNNVLNSCARVGDIHSALGVVKAIRERNIAMSPSTYHSVVICAGKSGKAELALEMLACMERDGFHTTPVIYNSVISACAKDHDWQCIRDLYNKLKPEQQAWLDHSYLSAVIMAFAKGDERDKHRAIAMLQEEKANGKTISSFGHNAVLGAFLDLHEYDRVIQLAKKMRTDRIPWDENTVRNVFFALFEQGQYRKAETLLEENKKHMRRSAECFRALIALYADKEDYSSACFLTMRMMEKNRKLNRFDWIHALEYALKLPNRKMYWNFRKWMEIRMPPSMQTEMPPHLMLHSKGKNLLGLDLSMEN